MYLELIRMRLEHQYYRTLDVRHPKPNEPAAFLSTCQPCHRSVTPSSELSECGCVVFRQQIRHDVRMLRVNFATYNRGEPTEWVEAFEGRLLACVDSASPCMTLHVP